MKVIACIEDPAVIQKILTHLQLNAEAMAPSLLPEPRAPPIDDLFDTLLGRAHAIFRDGSEPFGLLVESNWNSGRNGPYQTIILRCSHPITVKLPCIQIQCREEPTPIGWKFID